MPRLVIDSNYLRNPDLETYLGLSTSNGVIISDMVAMEMHKRNALVTAAQSTAILSQFLRQVSVLKNAEHFYGHVVQSAARARRLIDSAQTEDFPRYCAALRDASDKPLFVRQMEDAQKAAAAHTAQLLRDTDTIKGVFATIARHFTAPELEELRRRIPYSQSTQRKLLDTIFEFSRGLFMSVNWRAPYTPKTNGEAMNTFIFRYAMCMILLYTRWVHSGRQLQTKPERFANDVVDMNTAAMGTFFNGVLSNDEKLMSVHVEARYLLRVRRAYVG